MQGVGRHVRLCHLPCCVESTVKFTVLCNAVVLLSLPCLHSLQTYLHSLQICKYFLPCHIVFHISYLFMDAVAIQSGWRCGICLFE